MKAILGLTLPLLASASPLSIATIHSEAAPIISSVDAVEIPNSYLVVFKEHVTHSTAAVHHDWVQEYHAKTQLRKRSQLALADEFYGGLRHTYKIGTGLLGYAGHFDADVIEEIRRHPDVAYIEKDKLVHTMDYDEPELERNAPWGLARISHRDSLSFGTFNKYLYAEDGGEGVDVYIIDTGTNVEHVDFEGRAEWGKTIPPGDADEDGNGHGTHCSGTAVGAKYGVAKKAHVKAVKVLRSNGSGSMADVIKGVEWAVESHESKITSAKEGKSKKFKGSVANMSLGGGKSPALDRAVNAAVDAGMHFAVAAGNDNSDSCNYSPAAAANAVTVGASTFSDERAYFSNYGPCNDIFAPGLNIQSTWIGSKYAVNTISGTSMASPHIAGLLAYMLSLQPSHDSGYAVAAISPATLKKNLITIATQNALTDVPSDTTNILAWNGGGSSNYTSIIEKGSYTVNQRQEVSQEMVEAVEDFARELQRESVLYGHAIANSIHQLEHKLESTF